MNLYCPSSLIGQMSCSKNVTWEVNLYCPSSLIGQMSCSKNVTWEVNLYCLTLNLTAVVPAPSLVKWTRISWSWILREFIQFHKEKEQNSLPCFFLNLSISNKTPLSISSFCPLNSCSFKIYQALRPSVKSRSHCYDFNCYAKPSPACQHFSYSVGGEKRRPELRLRSQAKQS